MLSQPVLPLVRPGWAAIWVARPVRAELQATSIVELRRSDINIRDLCDRCKSLVRERTSSAPPPLRAHPGKRPRRIQLTAASISTREKSPAFRSCSGMKKYNLKIPEGCNTPTPENARRLTHVCPPVCRLSTRSIVSRSTFGTDPSNQPITTQSPTLAATSTRTGWKTFGRS